MKNEIKITINSMSGGYGDIWMRLIGFYTAAALLPIEINLLIPKPLRQLANFTFGDRLIILSDENISSALTYTSLGIRHLLTGIIKGERYLAPYHRSVIYDKKKKSYKDFLNIVVFNVADWLEVIQLPSWEYITSYQGYSDIIGIKKLKKIKYETFCQQIFIDYPNLSRELSRIRQGSSNLNVPSDIYQKIVVFPTGTGRQFISVEWAKKYLPDAYYAFFYRDSDCSTFQTIGLRTIKYYEPDDIIVLSNAAKWTVTTDSFPSHLLQYASKRCTVTITGTLKSRIVSPAFIGITVDAEAPCHPCVHLDRGNHPLCAAGFRECLNWNNTQYIYNILGSLPA